MWCSVLRRSYLRLLRCAWDHCNKPGSLREFDTTHCRETVCTEQPAGRMTAYLLPCTCGNAVTVDVRQAGDQVVCSCGRKLDVPPLRQLRRLSPVEADQTAAKPATWGMNQGVVTTCLILAAVLLAWSGWVWWNEPSLPKFDPQSRLRSVEEQIKTPIGAWESWIGYYRPLAERGLPVFHVANAAQIESRKADARFLRFMLWAIAAIFIIAAISAKFWPKSPSTRAAAMRG